MRVAIAQTSPDRPGYTLVELVIVLAILAVLWGIAAPRYANSTSRYRAEAASRRIAADLMMARAQARMTSKSVTVSFDAVSSGYAMAGITSLDNKSSNYAVNLAEEPYRATLASANFNGGTTVTFDAYGSADNSGQVAVSCGDVRFTVSVEGSSGKVSIP